MKILRGLSDYQVLQRDARNKGSVAFGGECRAEGEVRARVLLGRKPVAKFDRRRVGLARAGAWEASLSGLPVGGPYSVELEVRPRRGKPERGRVRDILVGDLWVLAGQSNMEGQGRLADALPPHPLVHSFAKRCEWEVAKEPTHFWLESPDSAHWYGMTEEQWREAVVKPQPARETGASPGLAFGRAMVEETGVPVGLVPTALGGSSIDQWNPAYKDKGTACLYGSMLEYVKRVGGPPVAGVLWWQAESETWVEALVKAFPEAFRVLVRSMREDLKQPDLPFIYVQICRVCGLGVTQPMWNRVQEDQRLALPDLGNSAVVSSIDLPLDDGIHVSGYGQKILGKRLATAALRMKFGRRLRTGPNFKGLELFGPEKKSARVWFTQVNGRMFPERHIGGFSVRDAEGKDLALIWDARPDPENAGAVLLSLDATPPAGSSLWYGWGTDPYCNLVDEEGMAALVFGPIWFGE